MARTRKLIVKDDKSSTIMMQDMLQTKEQEVIAQLQKMGFEVKIQNISLSMEDMIAYRHEEIQKIESEALLIQEITKDLATLVDEQQHQIDHIDANSQNAKQHISVAEGNLIEADKKDSRCVVL